MNEWYVVLLHVMSTWHRDASITYIYFFSPTGVRYDHQCTLYATYILTGPAYTSGKRVHTGSNSTHSPRFKSERHSAHWIHAEECYYMVDVGHKNRSEFSYKIHTIKDICWWTQSGHWFVVCPWGSMPHGPIHVAHSIAYVCWVIGWVAACIATHVSHATYDRKPCYSFSMPSYS